MRKKVIIFNDNEAMEIGAEYFFQHPSIKDLSDKEVISLLQSTKVYQSVIVDIRSTNPSDDIFDQDKLTNKYLNQVSSGVSILEGMVNDLLGEEIGNAVISKIEDNISEDKEDAKL